MEPLIEMTMCKGIETVFEAIPGSILQIYALILAEEKSADALISILVSAATIAFTSSMISYDWDTSPAKRKVSPTYYGFVPDKALPRAVCFISIISLSFAHVTLLCFSCALLTVMNPNWLLYFLGLDMALYFLYKILRGDFFSFLNIACIMRFVYAIFLRFATKLMANFTMPMQLCHPQEVGALPFLFSIVYSLVRSFASVYLFKTHYNGPAKLDEGTLRAVLGSLVAMWVVSLVSFALVIKRKYLHTF
ncbi:hypothetical protein TL16_g12845 [Triparma laevis f. inornata]|uniref:Uncharacterized protein n=1 Tax=Triparma laevis f. inornata TaxID=1714386 RepID=A0A9W7BPK0_9STRA|nr:hypothetical protein TL16_g12845 [Triparma laevis f. inornata]